MKILACVLSVLTICTGENLQQKEELLKRDLEHRSNLALLTSIHLGDDKYLNGLSPNPASIDATLRIDNRNAPPEENSRETYSPDNLLTAASAVPPPLTNDLFLTYAPAHRFPLQNIPIQNIPATNNLAHFPYETGTTLLTNNDIIQANIPQGAALPPHAYQYHVPKEVPYPFNIFRTVQVPIQVKVPIEVPKPYEVRVPHPVPVPVHIRVPVPVAKPYPIQVTKTVAVPVEKPVYIRVPQPVEVPVPQPYPVGVPQPVHIRVPVVVRFAEGAGNGLSSELANLDGTPFVQAAPLVNIPESSLNNVVVPDQQLNPGVTPSSVEKPCGTCDKVAPTTRRPVNVAPIKQSFTGNGLLPPIPPTKVPHVKSVIGGLLNSYVASKQGGVYRRSTKYQTAEYHKIW